MATPRPKAKAPSGPKLTAGPIRNSAPVASDNYDSVKERAAAKSRERSKKGREVGPLPSVKDPKRKAAGEKSYKLFAETYFPARFPLAWSQDHLDAIDEIEKCVLQGGQFASAMPRGSGKTTLAVVAAIWAIVYGHRLFLVLLAATGFLAKDLLLEIKTELETNELLGEDFPEICHCVRALEGINNRTAGQTLNGVRTRIVWTDKKLVLPTVPGSPASGAVLRAMGLTGAIRGLRHQLADGSTIRPDLVLIDDPQTRKSATSPAGVANRENLIAGDVLGLAGPGQRIAALMPCTVIAPGDAADRLLDRKLHPEWNGRRTKLCYAFPTNEKLWEDYARIRAESLEAGNDGREATEFYAKNRAAMDAGAVVAWEVRFSDDELSAVQNVMNLRLADYAVFMAEYQNDPVATGAAAALADAISAEAVVAPDRLTGLPRLTVPRECSRLTAMIDVQGEILFAVVVAWDAHFGGSVVDYLAHPKQNRDYYTAADPRPSLSEAYPGLVYGARLMKALAAFTDEIIGREYPREETQDRLTVDRCLIDANWPKSTEHVYKFCRMSPHKSILMPSHGRGISASMKPMDAWPIAQGDLAGPGWRIQAGTGTNKGRHVAICTNSWKSFVAERLKAPPGTPGALLVFGKNPKGHKLFADHVSSEYPIRTTGRDRSLDEWKQRPDRRENHWFDGLVGAAVAASIGGLKFNAAAALGLPTASKKPALSLRERQEIARMRSAQKASQKVSRPQP